MEQTRIVIQEKRQFGEFIGDGIKFIRENFGVLSISFLKYAMPLIMIGGYLYGAFLSKTFNNILEVDENLFGTATDIMIFVFCMFAMTLAYVIVQAIVYGLFHYYVKDDRDELTTSYLGGFALSNIFKILLVYFAIFSILILPIFLLGGLGAFAMGSTGLMAFIVFVIIAYSFVVTYFSLAWSFAPFISVHEQDVSIFEALKKSKELVSGYWWSLFGLVFVAGLLASIVSSIFTLPLQLVLGGLSFSGIAEGTSSPMLLGLFGIISFVGSAFLSMFTSSCLILKYFDLKERKGGHSLQQKIQSFGQEKSSSFENDGEY